MRGGNRKQVERGKEVRGEESRQKERGGEDKR